MVVWQVDKKGGQGRADTGVVADGSIPEKFVTNDFKDARPLCVKDSAFIRLCAKKTQYEVFVHASYFVICVCVYAH